MHKETKSVLKIPTNHEVHKDIESVLSVNRPLPKSEAGRVGTSVAWIRAGG